MKRHGTQKPIKMYTLAFPYLVTSIIIFIYLFCGISYAQNNICTTLKKYHSAYINQSNFSEMIFGIERGSDEIINIFSITNLIKKNHYSYDNYTQIIKCIDQDNSRFVKRNSTIFKLSLMSSITGSINKNKEKIIIKYIINALQSDNILVLSEAMDTTIPFNQDIFIPYLKKIIFIKKDNQGVQKHAIIAISLISGNKTKNLLNKLKEKISDPELIKLIDSQIKEFNYLYY